LKKIKKEETIIESDGPPPPPFDGPPPPPMDMDGDGGAPPPPDMDSDIPLPPGMSMGSNAKSNKKAIKSSVTMKPLHWKRVVVGGSKNPVLSTSLWSNINSINEKVEKEIDIKEIEELFSKVPEKKSIKIW